MIRYDLAQYLINIHALMDAQREAGSESSQWLLTEYQRGWEEFKKEITKEKKDETRPSKLEHERHEDRTEGSRREPSSSLSDRASTIR